MKCATVVWGDVIASGIDTWLEDDATCKLCRYTLVQVVSDLSNPEMRGGCRIYWGSWVFEPGTSIYADAGYGIADWTASGYVLNQAG